MMTRTINILLLVFVMLGFQSCFTGVESTKTITEKDVRRAELELEKGKLTVSAARNTSEEEKNEEGRVIRQERYMGSMQRSFYVGEFITEEDVKARFEDGVLKLAVPKKEAPKLPEKKSIAIEG